MEKTFVALCSPSTWWKTTLADMLKERDNYWTPEHFTTRDRRAWEEVKSWYTHISEEDFISNIKNWKINIFTVFNWNLYWYNANSSSSEKVIFVIEPKGIAHLERYCTENKIKLVSIFIGVDDATRKKRFLKREWNLDSYYERKITDDYISTLWPKYCDNIIYSSGWPERMYEKLKTIIQNEERWSLIHKLRKVWKKTSFQIKDTLLTNNK